MSERVNERKSERVSRASFSLNRSFTLSLIKSLSDNRGAVLQVDLTARNDLIA